MHGGYYGSYCYDLEKNIVEGFLTIKLPTLTRYKLDFVTGNTLENLVIRYNYLRSTVDKEIPH